MNKTVLVALTLALLMPPCAHAAPQPTAANVNIPSAYQTECGSCHLAFPPIALSPDDWQRVMTQLARHYGEDATLDENMRRQIEDFLVRNAGSPRRAAGAGDPPRLTTTIRFQRQHDEVAREVWSDKRVGTASNCAACHPRAEQGKFDEDEVRVPRMTRRDR
jgi:cytochrome c553